MTQHHNRTIENLLAYMPDGDAEGHALIRRAYDFAADAHAGQERDSGEPYIQHPLHVAHLLAEMHFEAPVIAAALLHDVLEDCEITRQQMRDLFGLEVLILVEGMTKLDAVEDRVEQDAERARANQELESLRKLLIAMAEDDIRVIFIKLADRLHNMRTLGALSEARQRRMARETLEIFAPVANRLGIWVWKAELEDLSFRYLNATMYDDLARLLMTRKNVREERVQKHVKMLKAALEEEGVVAEINGRPKHIYSIYHKMRRKHLPFSRIYDAEGLRVIVATKTECYLVLGIAHQLWTPVPGEFDDYIAHPKPNNYQSLHTAVIGEDGTSLEIQIRTRAMDHLAEYGVASHWRYKEQGVPVDSRMMDQIAVMRRSVRELTSDSNDARTFVESIRTDVFQDRVYAFTPKGKVIDLPLGATPLDFAYHVHTEVGHLCRGARVNGRWTPLTYQLQTGDQVQVLTGRKGGPSLDWLDEDLGFVKSNRARQKIKQWFRRQSREVNAEQGRIKLEKTLRRMGMDFTVEEVAEFFQKRHPQTIDFLAAIGAGDMQIKTIIDRLEKHLEELAEKQKTLADLEDELLKEEPRSSPGPGSEGGKISVRGTGGLLTNFAKCCNPLPGEEILGYVTRGRGVTIHRRDCPNILRMTGEDRERIIEVDWGASEERTFTVKVVVNAYDRSALLYDVLGVISNHQLNVLAVNSGERNRHNIIPVYITLDVPDLATLTRVLSKIEQIHNVIEAYRIG